jgi:hypothetical protein
MAAFRNGLLRRNMVDLLVVRGRIERRPPDRTYAAVLVAASADLADVVRERGVAAAVAQPQER